MVCFRSASYGDLRSKLSAVLESLKTYCFREHIVVVSHPLCTDGRWTIIQGDRFRFSVREFSSENEARLGINSIANATALGAGLVQAKIVVLEEEQARLVKDRDTYQAVLAFLENNSSQ